MGSEPIFVVGAGRSGTTMLQLMLNAHPNIAIIGELHYFDTIQQIQKWVPELNSPGSIDKFKYYLRRCEHYSLIPFMDELVDCVCERLVDAPLPSYEKFYQFIMEEYAVRQSASRFGEKTPANVRYLDELLQIFPDAKIVHLVRDPRAVAASTVKMPGASRNVLIHALSWKYDILLGRYAKERAAYIEVRYEDLVQYPREELKRITAFIGENYDEHMLNFHKSASKFLKNEPWKDGTKEPVNAAPIDKWKQQLTPSETLVVESVSGSVMDKFNYMKTIHGFWRSFSVPIVLSLELVHYGIHRIHKYWRNAVTGKKDGVPTIYSERKKLYRKVLKTMAVSVVNVFFSRKGRQ